MAATSTASEEIAQVPHIAVAQVFNAAEQKAVEQEAAQDAEVARIIVKKIFQDAEERAIAEALMAAEKKAIEQEAAQVLARVLQQDKVEIKIPYHTSWADVVRRGKLGASSQEDASEKDDVSERRART